MAKRFVKPMGLALLALTWLPMIFFGRHEASGLQGNQIRERSSTEVAYVVPSPIPATQFLQFRLSGFQSWFSKSSGPDFIAADFPSSRLEMEALDAPPSLAPTILLKAWQFDCRTALHPRAPCQV